MSDEARMRPLWSLPRALAGWEWGSMADRYMFIVAHPSGLWIEIPGMILDEADERESWMLVAAIRSGLDAGLVGRHRITGNTRDGLVLESRP